MSVQDDMMKAEAIREVRAAGCTMPGLAELIVEFHGAAHVLNNTSRIQALGDEVAASDSEQGAKMRQLLQGEAKKAEIAANASESSKPEAVAAVPAPAPADLAASAAAGTNSALPSAADLDSVAEEAKTQAASASAAPEEVVEHAGEEPGAGT